MPARRPRAAPVPTHDGQHALGTGGTVPRRPGVAASGAEPTIGASTCQRRSWRHRQQEVDQFSVLADGPRQFGHGLQIADHQFLPRRAVAARLLL